MDNRRNRTQAEKRDAERVTRAEHRIEHVIDQLVENVEGAQHSAHDSLNHEIHEHNITEWRSRLETALTVLKRSVYRMAQRPSYESLTGTARQSSPWLETSLTFPRQLRENRKSQGKTLMA